MLTKELIRVLQFIPDRSSNHQLIQLWTSAMGILTSIFAKSQQNKSQNVAVRPSKVTIPGHVVQQSQPAPVQQTSSALIPAQPQPIKTLAQLEAEILDLLGNRG
jgi:hypothetical protein